MADSTSEGSLTRLQVGPDLWVLVVPLTRLREADVNAQIMQPKQFDRLTENIRTRGQVESLPYCHASDGLDQGPLEIISGHHRVRAARAAGLTEIPVLVDTSAMRRSEKIAKQIAHNELHGEPDEDVLEQMIAMMDNVDDLLTSGLDQEYLPSVEKDDTVLQLPHADFDWRQVTLVFLPEQVERLEELVSMVASGSDLVGVARMDQFARFSDAMVAYGRAKDIRSMAMVVDELTRLAIREINAVAEDGVAVP